MRSHLATQRLSAYLDDELRERELERVEAHISECPTCQSRLHGLRLVVSELQRVPPVDAPPSLARSIEAEAAMRWGPRGPRAGGLLGRRGLALLSDMIQWSAVSAGAVAIIALMIAYGSTRHVGAGGAAPGALGQSRASASAPAADRVVAGGRFFVWRDGAWWQEDLAEAARASEPPEAPASGGGATARSMSLLPERPAHEALALAPWLVELLRRGPVVVELDGAAARVDLATAPGSSSPAPGRNQAPGSIATTR